MWEAWDVTVRVGFIGSAHSVSRLTAGGAHVPAVELRTYPYEDPHDTSAQYAAALAENDVVCFSGTIAHYHRDRSLDTETPVLVGRFSDYTLASSLLAATAGTIDSPAVAASPAARADTLPLTIAELSVDMPNPEVAGAVARDTGVALQPDQVFDYRWVYQPRFTRPVDVAELVAFHLDRRERAGARLAITSVHAVFDRLSADGIPVMYMIDSQQRDLDLLRMAQQRVSVRRLEGALLAVIYLSTQHALEPGAPGSELRDELVGILSSFATPVQHRLASWQRGGLDMFYTTRAEFDARLGDLTGAMRHTGGAVTLGVGIGAHMYEAEDRALQALRRAIAESPTSAFMVDEDSRVQDLLDERAAASESRHTAPWLVALSSRAGMHSRSLTRFFGFLATRDFRPFTTAEWAAASQTSARTAERALRKLLDVDAIAVIGQEQPLDAGRPRSVYALAPAIEAAARRHFADQARGQSI